MNAIRKLNGSPAIRKVCVVVNSRANYARIKSVMRAVQQHNRLELQLVVGASALLYRYGNVVDLIRADGFEPSAVIYSIVEGENPTTMAKSTGMGIIELSSQLENLQPDIVLTVADRFETMATAIAAAYMNIPLAHTQGGEVTGSIDESVRHAITKLAHIHFPATERAHSFVVRMGEAPETVHMTGCPAIDLLVDTDLSLDSGLLNGEQGTGAHLDPSRPYMVVLQHPVTTEYGSGYDQISATLEAVRKIDMQTVWLWPNVDAGSDDVSKGLRMYREENPDANVHFYRNFPAEEYARLINNSAVLVGNSSSALREGAYLGVPAVNVGTRQGGREHAANVCHADYEPGAIEQAARSQMDHGRYESSHMFGDGHAGVRIANLLADSEITVQKRLAYA
ncbi:MAG: UDP-N-acetylglucosamine 2-epimerase (hydrolyzing) [Rhodospirillaceae bacterium]|jgi:UDP-hydrolysing UDP-N-acetyl-D-glucosamine 2-epimerase|nr:UDP-N-acetylglucosamine 2-epimerase (hydrolyzing) [Rhodospirillaceae bacterium]MBT3810836.1 UDP-N-acetylglucosamine 2-epimerase (hydrolyzing) [Rhodospirillaceae bacterium]MBT3930443.1 UDP-N-acetylglucosamine 2-epimerase (hydrolyzing) [Rhodospirillaceae bacterium]MBT4773612.1 UDP-N-acetylglucosamine 2-epimerase (hydrolyzing) [Rhodospirillaceae bacterium]MBT5360032.1 UDP-N-acetylglucosamine 2-epimerase (hydrolyzing) [Rhodospirillaceae bacterium]